MLGFTCWKGNGPQNYTIFSRKVLGFTVTPHADCRCCDRRLRVTIRGLASKCAALLGSQSAVAARAVTPDGSSLLQLSEVVTLAVNWGYEGSEHFSQTTYLEQWLDLLCFGSLSIARKQERIVA